MKEKSVFIILVLVIIGLLYGLLYQKKHYQNLINDISVDSNNSGWTSNDYVEKEYNCNFTKTYRVVNLLDGYIAEVPEWSYVILDQFQNHKIYAAKIPTKLKEGLEENKYYEFKYIIVGNGDIKSMEDINDYIVLDDVLLNSNVYSGERARVILSIVETDKEGLEQVQQDICLINNDVKAIK